jgi:hypothetical protein
MEPDEKRKKFLRWLCFLDQKKRKEFEYVFGQEREIQVGDLTKELNNGNVG